MGNKGTANRDRIIEAADALFYHRGYNQTSFSDIAEASDLPRGNFYYYFKSKDEILSAVIEQRLASIGEMLNAWEEEFSDPRVRLKRFVQMLRNSSGEVVRYGCPIGSLSAELGKTQLPLQSEAARTLHLFSDWRTRQLRLLGQPDAGTKAMHLLALAQGASLVSSVYHDQAILDGEAARMDAWIDSC